MEITILHGQMHKGNTYHITEMLKEKLTVKDTVVHEYFLPKDTPSFCVGCFQCILKGEEYCPQAAQVQKIAASMQRSEIIMIDSPTYCFEMTGQLKTLFDHFGYMWMSHRPRKEMFSKIGIVISSAAGAGGKNVTKSIAKQLFWWGVPKVHQLHFNVSSMSWKDTSDKIKLKITQKIEAVTRQVSKQAGKEKYNFKIKFLFHIMRKMQEGNKWNLTDRNYWQTNNWLGAVRPWRSMNG